MTGNIKKTTQKHGLNDYNEIKGNLEYWLSRPPKERVEAVDILRKRAHGNKLRLKRVCKVIKLK